MASFAANLTMLFTELPMMERFEAAHSAGFNGVEILFPYDIPTDQLRDRLFKTRMEFVLMNAPPPNWAGGPRGFAADPGQQERFRRDFDTALRLAQTLNARHLHIMSGRGHGAQARRTYVENLTWAARRAPRQSLLIEPMNQHDMPGYFLSDYDLAAEVIDAVAAPNLGLLFDAYHAYQITGDTVECWQRHSRLVRHVQIAGAPGRHEPRHGDIDFAGFFRAVDKAGYRGWVGAEYTPATTTQAGLRWLRGGDTAHVD